VRGTAATTACLKTYRDAGGVTRVDYVFTRKGTFIVHLLINEEYALTYSVRVSG